ncbi:MAG: hypothetical protein IPI67_17700 [Myxococcales bacterium]|nr:hypothetical protein [Myxococcales bacterium]
MKLRHAPFTLIGATFLALSCSGIEELPKDQPCQDVALSIAQRTMDCTDDAGLAQERLHAFDERYSCVPVDVAKDDVGNLYHCSSAVGGMNCEQVKQAGDDLDQWLTVSTACTLIIHRADGSPL